MNTITIDRLLNKILELPMFMSIGVPDLRDRYSILLGPHAVATKADLTDYLISELENLKKSLLVQQYGDLDDDEALFVVDERFYSCEKKLIEGPFERRLRIGLDAEDIQTLRNREGELQALLAEKRGEIDECGNLTQEVPALERSLGEKHRELMIQASVLEGRIQIIKETIKKFSGLSE